jgi:hypothetical protein
LQSRNKSLNARNDDDLNATSILVEACCLFRSSDQYRFAGQVKRPPPPLRPAWGCRDTSESPPTTAPLLSRSTFVVDSSERLPGVLQLPTNIVLQILNSHKRSLVRRVSSAALCTAAIASGVKPIRTHCIFASCIVPLSHGPRLTAIQIPYKAAIATVNCATGKAERPESRPGDAYHDGSSSLARGDKLHPCQDKIDGRT